MSIDPTGWNDADQGAGEDHDDSAEQAGDGGSFDQSLPEPPVTGDQAVDHAVAEVARAVVRPLEDQVAVIDAAHRTLQDRLADVEG